MKDYSIFRVYSVDEKDSIPFGAPVVRTMMWPEEAHLFNLRFRGTYLAEEYLDHGPNVNNAIRDIRLELAKRKENSTSARLKPLGTIPAENLEMGELRAFLTEKGMNDAYVNNIPISKLRELKKAFDVSPDRK